MVFFNQKNILPNKRLIVNKILENKIKSKKLKFIREKFQKVSVHWCQNV